MFQESQQEIENLNKLVTSDEIWIKNFLKNHIKQMSFSWWLHRWNLLNIQWKVNIYPSQITSKNWR